MHGENMKLFIPCVLKLHQRTCST